MGMLKATGDGARVAMVAAFATAALLTRPTAVMVERTAKCSEYNRIELAAAVEVGTGCWNQHAADSAGNWGWCANCDGGNLRYCCTPDKTYGCDGGKNCKCSQYNRIENLAAAVEVGTGCWNQHAADPAGNWGW